MDHLPWYSQSRVSPVKVPFICGDGPICRKEEFLSFPTRQGWQLEESESLAQLAKRAQAWLFFGLLAMVDISPDACVASDTSSMGFRIIDTSLLLYIRQRFEHALVPYRDSLVNDTSSRLTAEMPVTLDGAVSDISNDTNSGLTEALAKAEDVMKWEVIPLLRDYEEQQPLHLWNSASFAILFSIDVLMDTLARNVPDQECKKRRSELLFPKRTKGVAGSLLHVGKCGSLARRLGLNSSELYHLMSLPVGSANQDHSFAGPPCSETSCNRFNVKPENYHTRHTAQHEEGFVCKDIKVLESELVHLIRKSEVPLVRSTMDSDGNITIAITNMSMRVDYTAISHVWAGGLGNFKQNSLPNCQLKAIHQDVCNTMLCAYEDSVAELEKSDVSHGIYTDILDGRLCRKFHKQVVLFLNSRAPCSPRWYSRRTKRTTCHYWMDTLCIPVNHDSERQLAINAMGRIYAGAANVLVLDPALSSINYDDLGKGHRKKRANMLVDASPWMARSWPLQEAALAHAIYVKFVDQKVLYKHSCLGAAATLTSLPNQEENEEYLSWSNKMFPVDNLNAPDVLLKPRVLRPYGADSDFIQVWNLLSKRTTSYPDDVLAIFAALLHRSAGAILSFESHLRTWAIIRTLESLPLDILLVKQKPQQDQSTTQTPPWIPEFPGSEVPVPLLNSRWGTLKRVANGFIVDLNNIDPTTTRALVCPAGLVRSSQSLLRDVHSTENFSIQVDRPQLGSKAKANDTGEESRLLLLLSKEHPEIPFTNHGVLCTIKAGAGNTLRVRIDSTIGWSSKTDHLPEDSAVDCFAADASCSILIEMDFEHWPVLTWSRFTAYPYQHLQTLSYDLEFVYYLTASTTWYLAASVSLIFCLFGLLLDGFLASHGILLCSLFTTIAMPTRMDIARLEGIHAATARARRARYIWASSFWDEDKAKKILSRSRWTVPLNPFLIDMGLAAFFTSVVAFAILRGLDSREWLFALCPFALEYYLRCLFHIFVQVQWFCSTLELHDQRTLRLFSSLMSIHFFRACTGIFCLMIALAFAWATIAGIIILRGSFSGQGDGEISWVAVVGGLVVFLLSVLASCIFLYLSGWQFWNIIRDTFWRVKRTYSRDDWARRHTTTTPDREIQLV